MAPSEEELRDFNAIPQIQELQTVIDAGLIPGLLDNSKTDRQYEEEILRYLNSLGKDRITAIKDYITTNKVVISDAVQTNPDIPPYQKNVVKRRITQLERRIIDYEQNFDNIVRRIVENLFKPPIINDVFFVGKEQPKNTILPYLNSTDIDTFKKNLDAFWNQISPADKSRMLEAFNRDEARISSSAVFNEKCRDYLIAKIKEGTSFQALLTGALQDGGDLSRNLFNEAPLSSQIIKDYLNHCGLDKREQLKAFFVTHEIPADCSEIVNENLALLRTSNEVALFVKDEIGSHLIERMDPNPITQQDQVFAYLEGLRLNKRAEIAEFLRQNATITEFFCTPEENEFLKNINFKEIENKISSKQALDSFLPEDLLNSLFTPSEKNISLDDILTIESSKLGPLNSYLQSNKTSLEKIIDKRKLDYLSKTCTQYQKLEDLGQAELFQELFNDTDPQKFQLWLLKKLDGLSPDQRQTLLDYFKKNASQLRAINNNHKIDKLQYSLIHFDVLKILLEAEKELAGFATPDSASSLLESLLAGKDNGIVPYLQSETKFKELNEYLEKNKAQLKPAIPWESGQHLEKLHNLAKTFQHIDSLRLTKGQSDELIVMLSKNIFEDSEQIFKRKTLAFLEEIDEPQRNKLVAYLQENEQELLSMSEDAGFRMNLAILQNLSLNYSLLESESFPTPGTIPGSPPTGIAAGLASDRNQRERYFHELTQMKNKAQLKQQAMINAGFSPDGSDFIDLIEADKNKLNFLVDIVDQLKSSPAVSVAPPSVPVELSLAQQIELLARGIVLPSFVFSAKEDKDLITQFSIYLTALGPRQQKKLEQEVERLQASSDILTAPQKQRLSRLRNLLQHSELVTTVSKQIKNQENYFKILSERTQKENQIPLKEEQVKGLAAEVERLVEYALKQIEINDADAKDMINKLRSEAPPEKQLASKEALRALSVEEKKQLIRDYPFKKLKETLERLDENQQALQELNQEVTALKKQESETKEGCPLFTAQTKKIEEKALELRKLTLVKSLLNAIKSNNEKIEAANNQYDWDDVDAQHLAEITTPLKSQNKAFESLVEQLKTELKLSDVSDLAERKQQALEDLNQLKTENNQVPQQFFEKITSQPKSLEKIVIPQDCLLKSYDSASSSSLPAGKVKASPNSIIGSAFSSITLSAQAGHELYVQDQGRTNLYISVANPNIGKNNEQGLRDLSFMLYSQWVKTKDQILIDAASEEDANKIKQIFQEISKENPEFKIQSHLAFRGPQPQMLNANPLTTEESDDLSKKFKMFKDKVNDRKEDELAEVAAKFLVKNCANPDIRTEITQIKDKTLKTAILERLRTNDNNPYLNVARANYFKQLNHKEVKDNNEANEMLKYLNDASAPTKKPPAELEQLKKALKSKETTWFSKLRGN